MERSTRRRAVLATAMLAVGSVFALALPTAAWAAAPSFVDPPTRLYMLPNADGPLPASVPFPVVPDGVMTFDGTTDLISLQDRKLEVESAENDCTPGPEFALSGCTAIQFDVGHGTLDFFPAPSAVDDSDSTFDAYVLPSGAIVRDMDSADDLPAKITAIVGTTQQVNEAMQTLRYTPDEDYYYNGSNPETLRVDLIPGDGTLGTVEADVEIRVQDLNDFPEATVPPDLFTVDPGLEVTLGTPDQWEVTDADNDEVTDGEESPGEGDTIDGEGTELLVIAWATCGRIHLQGASGFEIGDDLEELVGSALGFDDPPTVDQQAVIDAFLEIVPDEVESLPFATGNQNEPTAAFAGVADDISWVNYALDEVVFEAVDPTTLAPLGDQTCDVNTLVSDLGNNGLPLNYVGSPPSGVETPFFGFDVDTNEAPGVERVTVKVGEGTEIDVTMPTDATVAEGATDVLPIAITPAVHPAFDLTVSSTPNAPATAGVDYTSLSAVTVPIPENATDASVPVDALQDLDLDPGETYSVTLTPPATPPPGYTVTSSDPSALVTIDDDEVDPGDAVAPTVTLNQGATQVDPTSVSPIVFDVVFSEPVVGFTASDVVLGGTAGATTVVISGAGPAYTVSVSGMTVGGDVFATIPAGAVVDASPNANPSAASTSEDNTVIFTVDPGDVVAPTVTLNQGATQVDPTSVSPIVFDVVFSEPVVGFTASDVVLGGTAGATTVVISGAGPAYTVSVSGMTVGGEVFATIPAGAVVDASPNANPSAASTSEDNTVIFTVDPGDVVAPTVTLNQGATQVDPTSVSPIVFDVVFSEPVVGFTASDVVLGGTAGATTVVISGAGPAYTVSVSGMTVAGDVFATIPAGAVVDASPNANPSAASTSEDNTVLWTLVSEPPALTIDVPDDIVVPNDPGEAGAEVAFALPTTAGGVPPTTVDCDAASGDFFPIGVTTVNCTATDSDQSMFEIILFAVVADSFTITVEDVEPPVIADNPDLVRTTPGPSVVVDFVNPVATDNSGDDPTVECVPASGTSFAVGVSTVTCTATDAAGNTATSSFTVTVTTATSEEPTPSPTPTPGSPGDSGSPGGGTSGGGGSGTGTGTMASTGVAASGSLHLALLMLIAGAALLLATRRRSHPGR